MQNTKAQSTKEAILTAAKTLFIEHGYEGASIGKIAKLAKVNHSLVFHHFTNKQQLWLAVKLAIVKEAKLKQAILPSTELNFADFLQQLFQNNIHFYKNHPELIRLLNWQRLEKHQSIENPATQSEELQAWLNAFQYYQVQGDINPDLDIRYLINMLLALTTSAALDPNLLSYSEKEFELYLQFCINSLLKIAY